jgi:hypothetical protein
VVHLELTTSIGVGGFGRLTRAQQADALGWLIHERSPPKPAKVKTPEDRHREALARVRERWGKRGD